MEPFRRRQSLAAKKFSQNGGRQTDLAAPSTGMRIELHMSAPFKNQFAVKAITASSHLHLRCEPGEKARWVRAAQRARKKLAQWTKDTLNRASREAP